MKHVAQQAYLELEAKLAGGAGSAVSNLVTGFSVMTTNNYAPVNLGQLKYVAKPFYDRLIFSGYTNSYPWTPTLADDKNYALANLGQLKYVFSFDLKNFTNVLGEPTIEIISPQNNAPVFTPQVHVKAKGNLSDATVTINGKAAAKDGYFYYAWVPVNQGNTMINAVINGNGKQKNHQISVAFNPQNYDPNADEDGDGVPNGVDLFPGDPGESQDSDQDGVGDNADPDAMNSSIQKSVWLVEPLNGETINIVPGQDWETARNVQVSGQVSDDSGEVVIEVALQGMNGLYYVDETYFSSQNLLKQYRVPVANQQFSTTVKLFPGKNLIRVINASMAKVEQEIVLKVQPAPIKVELSWAGGQQDYNLELQGWGVALKPAVDIKNSVGPATETILLNNPTGTIYNISVRYAGNNGVNQPQTTTVKVYYGNQLVKTMSRLINQIGSRWNAGTLVVYESVSSFWNGEREGLFLDKNNERDLLPQATISDRVKPTGNYQVTSLQATNSYGQIYNAGSTIILPIGKSVQLNAIGNVNVGTFDAQNGVKLRDIFKTLNNNNFTIQVDKLGVLTAQKPGQAQVTCLNYNGQPLTIVVPRLDLGLDVNGDSKVNCFNLFVDPITPEKVHDQTLTAHSEYFQAMRFWVNKDDDTDGSEGDNVPIVFTDSDDALIDSKRDLEDFSRIWINATNILSQLQSGTLTLGLRWQGTGGDPILKLYKSCEPDGGKKYLEDETTATTQIGGSYGNALIDKNDVNVLKKETVFQFTKEFWSSVNANDPVAHLLFEAAGEGKGQLTTVLFNSQGKEIGRGPAHYFQLMDVRKMYYRAKVTPEDIPTPYEFAPDQPLVPNLTFKMDPENPKDPDPNKNAFVPYNFDNYKMNAVVFVHGWRLTEESARNFGETMFKRLWHQGYRDLFATLRWPTYYHDLPPFGKFNESEYRAWKCGKPLKEFVNYFKANFMTGFGDIILPQVNLVAHSMGNVVVGSALKQGLMVTNYVLMQAAVPAGCYDVSENMNNYQDFLDAETETKTPDWEGNLGYRGYLAEVTNTVTKLINFYNPVDYALTQNSWEQNQIVLKPDYFGFFPNQTTYVYHDENSPYIDKIFECWLNKPNDVERQVIDGHEAMSFVARPRSQAVGITPTSGSIQDNVNLKEAPYNFTDSKYHHSGQFNRKIQELDEFYSLLHDSLKLEQ
jgi:hypothetical protein